MNACWKALQKLTEENQDKTMEIKTLQNVNESKDIENMKDGIVAKWNEIIMELTSILNCKEELIVSNVQELCISHFFFIFFFSSVRTFIFDNHT